MYKPSLLKLMYLVSPALPIGAYAYSQGQEYAVDCGWLKNEHDLSSWIGSVMRCSLGQTDVPVLAYLYDAWAREDFECVNKWNQFLRASRETKELLLEDEQLGQGLARVLTNHGIDQPLQQLKQSASFVTLFALAGVEWGIDLDDLQHGFLWSWLENQVAAATKAVPLGQTQAQRVLMLLIDDIPVIVERAKSLELEQIGAGMPGLAIASSLHERQYSRLFRS